MGETERACLTDSCLSSTAVSNKRILAQTKVAGACRMAQQVQELAVKAYGLACQYVFDP